MKALGEGDWKAKKHGADKRRAWRKVQLVLDAYSHEVWAVEMTDHRHGDGEILPRLLAQLPKEERIGVISGDGAYHTRKVYEPSAARLADPASCCSGGTASQEKSEPPGRPRGTRRCASSGTSDGCCKCWESGDHRRSLDETAMPRLERRGERLWPLIRPVGR
ncbi:transposase [Roseomonas sp. SG15]|uniref:Transposase n=1 Tax=Roseomonas indoligenes TaxID=2820811 RepID=A0A940S924_9PROT|nr:transposase [Pararoseomonas indoligenes]